MSEYNATGDKAKTEEAICSNGIDKSLSAASRTVVPEQWTLRDLLDMKVSSAAAIVGTLAVIVGLAFGAGKFFVGGPIKSESPPLPSAIITSPEGTKVSTSIDVEGKVEAVPKGKDLWLVTERQLGGRFWPKQMIVPRSDGRFGHEIWDHGITGRVWVCVVMVEPSESKLFTEWLTSGEKLKNWQPLVLNSETSTMLTCRGYDLENPGP